MIDFYYWTTPNGHKIAIYLEEANLAYKIHPVNLQKGDQMKPEFLKISPNNKMPAIVDHDVQGGGSLPLFESGAILMYLARKTGQFTPSTLVDEMRMLQWLFWQVGGVGPMTGQLGHFKVFAKEKIPYAIDRYTEEVKRLYKVANTELSHSHFLGSKNYSIADMATYPWIEPHKKFGIDSLGEWPHLERWLKEIAERPAVKRVYAQAKEINPDA